MKRFHVHVSVEKLDESIRFYASLFGAAPTVVQPDYAKWMLDGRVEGRRACCRWRVSSPALSIARWVHNSTVATFPAPATSNAACGFPALRFPARFTSRVMGPILLGALSAPVVGAAPGSP